MELAKLDYPSGAPDDYLKELFSHEGSNFHLQYGTAFLKKGVRTPFEGDWTKHDQSKIVCILKGNVQLKLEAQNKGIVILKPGDLFKVDKFEGHAGEILEDTQLIYVMYGKKGSLSEY